MLKLNLKPSFFTFSFIDLKDQPNLIMEFRILGSSSSGNCSLIVTDKTRILIDAGFSGKRIKEMLEEIGVSLESIDAVFFTHEHSDHATGLRGLSKYPNIQFFTNRDTAQALQQKATKPIVWNLFESGTSFEFKDLHITTFTIPHDAYDPVGFFFKDVNPTFNTPESVAWVTDLGHIPLNVQNIVKDAQILVLEANYDDMLLQEDTKRPWSIKQRIQSRHGHLSNDQAYQFLHNNINDSQWQHIYLAHLSRDCNCPNKVSEIFTPFTCHNCTVDVITDAHKPHPVTVAVL